MACPVNDIVLVAAIVAIPPTIVGVTGLLAAYYARQTARLAEAAAREAAVKAETARVLAVTVADAVERERRHANANARQVEIASAEIARIRGEAR